MNAKRTYIRPSTKTVPKKYQAQKKFISKCDILLTQQNNAKILTHKNIFKAKIVNEIYVDKIRN